MKCVVAPVQATRIVIPAKAGIQRSAPGALFKSEAMDPRLRGDDSRGEAQ